MLTRFIPILALAACVANADYYMALAKETRKISLQSPKANIRLLMDDTFKAQFEKDLPADLQKNGITVGDVGEQITVIPVMFDTYLQIAYERDIPPHKSMEQVDMIIAEEAKKQGGIDSREVVGSFVTGFTRYGSEGAARSVSSGLTNAAGAGIALVGVVLAVKGINHLSTSVDDYELISDVYFGKEHTRIFAYCSSYSVTPEEAVIKLSALTSQKIAELASAKGEQR